VFHPGSGRYGHPIQKRIITMREAARLQSFSDDFEFIGSINGIAGQIGNAVPPRFMAAFAPIIKQVLKSF
jgi:DNA (cytosine-5)-methyltransferase 1